ncbi:Putative oxidoreductase GLYR1 [Araneus ventricosus]|uniref:Cytokine-like nuclear factor N-PAC n=1 Tax=Araneus ventricosus TaxID=182803 RepID=A0A4Y2P9X6_ARAVE|nr:Putative oxidoreductase GLYR1 [Araneus ventricosus]
MLAKDFEVGDLVWAKMKNFPPWPGQIVDPPANAKPRKGSHYVFFLGSKNYAWMKDETINHHAEHLIPPTSKKKTALLQSAIVEIIELSKDRPFKVDRNVESTDGPLFEVSPKTKSPKEDKLKDNKRSPKSKISRKRLSSSKLGKRSLEYSKSPKVRRFDEESSSRDLDINSPSKSPKVRRFDEESSSRDLDINSPHLTIISSYDDDIALAPRYGERLSDSHRDANKSSDLMRILKHVPPTSKKIGFLGLGNMGQGIAKNLLGSGHDVTVWNRTPGKCLELIKAGAVSSENPAEVVKASDIIFCCVSDPYAVKSLVFGHNGVLKGLEDSIQTEGREKVYKGYVEMTSIDFETSIEISEAIEIKGGRYLEASLVGSKAHAEEGNLLILASGNRELFGDCKTCFHAISNVAYYLSSDVGQSSKFSLVISALMGTTFAAMAEALALAERTKVSPYDFLKILELKGFSCPEVIDRAKAIIAHKFGALNTALKHQQKDMDLTLLMSNQFPQPMPVTTAANELYKHAKLLGYGDHDITSVFYGAKY